MIRPQNSWLAFLLMLVLPHCGSFLQPVQAQGANEATPEVTPSATPDPKQPIKMGLSSPFAITEKPLLVQSRWGCWIPIQVTLSNTGEPVSGRLELRLTYSLRTFRTRFFDLRRCGIADSF